MAHGALLDLSDDPPSPHLLQDRRAPDATHSKPLQSRLGGSQLILAQAGLVRIRRSDMARGQGRRGTALELETSCWRLSSV